MSLHASGNTDPGRLDRRVRLDYRSVTRDVDGGEVVSWLVAGSVWAEKSFVRGGPMVSAQAKHYEDLLVYRIRARSDVRPGWRLVHGDDVYEIVSISELGRQHLLQLEVRAIDQSSHSALSVLLLHDGSPFLLHSGEFLSLHREQDAA